MFIFLRSSIRLKFHGCVFHILKSFRKYKFYLLRLYGNGACVSAFGKLYLIEFKITTAAVVVGDANMCFILLHVPNKCKTHTPPKWESDEFI